MAPPGSLLYVVGLLLVATFAATEDKVTRGEFCQHGRLHCPGTSQCILEESRCDGVPDCPDGQDEDDCETSMSAFDCSSETHYQFLPKSYRCDGIPDCIDGVDEKGCPAELDVFECWPQYDGNWTGRAHINKVGVCDGVNDCFAGLSAEDISHLDFYSADEANCSSGCAPDAYLYDGACYRSTIICDGVSDYTWDEDEKHCLKCRVGEYDVTFYKTSTCDGKRDCDDGEDEKNCYPNCTEGWMPCSSLHVCMEAKEWCNGDCPGQDVPCAPTDLPYGLQYHEVALIALSALLVVVAVILACLLWVCQYRRLVTALKRHSRPGVHISIIP